MLFPLDSIYTHTQNNKSNKRRMNNTRPCAMNIRMPPCWKKQMFTILLFDVNDMKGLRMQLGFKSWIISSIFGTFVSNNGEVL